MHTVAVLALSTVIPFDLSTPVEVFTRARLPDGRPGYQIRACAETPEIDAGAFALHVPWGLEGLADADTVIRIASICTGTFPLAPPGCWSACGPRPTGPPPASSSPPTLISTPRPADRGRAEAGLHLGRAEVVPVARAGQVGNAATAARPPWSGR
jgi:hypothetical protein